MAYYYRSLHLVEDTSQIPGSYLALLHISIRQIWRETIIRMLDRRLKWPKSDLFTGKLINVLVISIFNAIYF